MNVLFSLIFIDKTKFAGDKMAIKLKIKFLARDAKTFCKKIIELLVDELVAVY